MSIEHIRDSLTEQKKPTSKAALAKHCKEHRDAWLEAANLEPHEAKHVVVDDHVEVGRDELIAACDAAMEKGPDKIAGDLRKGASRVPAGRKVAIRTHDALHLLELAGVDLTKG